MRIRAFRGESRLSSLRSLRNRSYRRLWLARTISGFGDSLIPVTMVFAILRAHGTAANVGEALACYTVGQVLVLPIGGVWADRLPRRLVLIATDTIQAVCYATLAAVILAGFERVWMFAALNTLAGMANAFFLPASSGIVPELVPAEELQPANALLGLSGNATSLLGPSLAGVLLAFSSAGPAFAMDAVSFVISALCLAGLPLARREPKPRTGFLEELGEGWRAALRRRWYLTNLLAHGLWNFAIAFFFVLGPVQMLHGHGGAAAWSAVSACIAVGAIGGGLLALRLRPRRPMVLGNLVITTAAVPLLALAFGANLVLVAVGAIVCFGSVSLLNEVWNAAVQQIFPAEVLSRISSFDWLISLCAMPAGYAVAGPLADQLGMRTCLVVAAAVATIPCAAVCLLPGVRGVRRRADGTVVDGASAAPPPGGPAAAVAEA